MTFAPPLLKIVSLPLVPVIKALCLVLVILLASELEPEPEEAAELVSAATFSSSTERLAALLMIMEPEPPVMLVVSLRAPLIVSRLVIVALLRSMTCEALNPTIVSLPPP